MVNIAISTSNDSPQPTLLSLRIACLLISAACCGGYAATAPALAAATEPAKSAKTDPLVMEIDAIQLEDYAKDPAASLAKLEALSKRVEAAGKRVSAVKRAELRSAYASAYFYLQDYARSVAASDAAIAMMRAAGVDDASPTLLDMQKNRATSLVKAGRMDEALPVFDMLRQRYLARNEKRTQRYVSLMNEVAVVNFMNGRYVEAEAAMGEATVIARELEGEVMPQQVALFWQNWASILGELGQLGRAIEESQAVAKYAEYKLGPKHTTTATAFHTLGTRLQDAGRYAESEAVLRRALEMRLAMHGAASESTAKTQHNLASAVLGQGRAQDALALFQAACTTFDKQATAAKTDSAGICYVNAARSALAAGRPALAIDYRRKAVDLLKASVGMEHPSYARASTDLGKSLLDEGKDADALAILERAGKIYAARLPATSKYRITTDLLLGVARQRNGDDGGYAAAREAFLRAGDTLISQVTDPVQTLRTAADYREGFVEFAAFALQGQQHEDAFLAMQLAQLGDLDNAGAAYVARRTAQRPDIAALARELQDEQAKLGKARSTRNGLVLAGKIAELEAADAAIQAMQAKSESLATRLQQAFPEYAQLVRPDPQRLAAVRARLASNEALLLTTPKDDGILSMLVTRDSTSGRFTRLDGLAVNDLVRRMRDSIDAAILTGGDPADFDAAAARALHTAIMPAALDARIAQARRLYVMAGGALASVPMAALVTAGQPTENSGEGLRKLAWLIKRQSVSTPVSLRMLGQSSKAAADAQPRFAGIGAPALAEGEALAMRGVRRVLRGGNLDAKAVALMPSLPGADMELQRIGQALGDPGALLLTGPRATEAEVRKADLSRYDVLAFATHGLVGGSVRGLAEPSLVLTPGRPDDPADDGLLTASDIAGLKLDADWVILSACDTAAGEGAGAPMFSGLARAFVHAGTRSLLLSQWEVRDDVAARLSVETVQRARRGAGRAEALRQAQLRLIADRKVENGAHPATWAPFMLIGD